MPTDRPRKAAEAQAADLHDQLTCAICGRVLWSDGLPPAQDGNAWICGDCDQARNFEALDC
jgi:transcription elongation factor Elf1